MTDERWESLVARMMDRFPNARFQKFTEENDWGVDEKHEVLMFQNKDQKYELERVTRPRVEDRKMTYSKRRPGAQESITYSRTDFVNFVKFYRLEGDHWSEIDLDAIESEYR